MRIERNVCRGHTGARPRGEWGALRESQGNLNTEVDKYIHIGTLSLVIIFLPDRIFSQPYPQATAGTPLSLSYDPYSRVMEFSFLPNLQIVSATEIFVPPLVYTEGFRVSRCPPTGTGRPRRCLRTKSWSPPTLRRRESSGSLPTNRHIINHIYSYIFN